MNQFLYNKDTIRKALSAVLEHTALGKEEKAMKLQENFRSVNSNFTKVEYRKVHIGELPNNFRSWSVKLGLAIGMFHAIEKSLA